VGTESGTGKTRKTIALPQWRLLIVLRLCSLLAEGRRSRSRRRVVGLVKLLSGGAGGAIEWGHGLRRRRDVDVLVELCSDSEACAPKAAMVRRCAEMKTLAECV
jgi:hypothetical protein